MLFRTCISQIIFDAVKLRCTDIGHPSVSCSPTLILGVFKVMGRMCNETSDAKSLLRNWKNYLLDPTPDLTRAYVWQAWARQALTMPRRDRSGLLVGVQFVKTFTRMIDVISVRFMLQCLSESSIDKETCVVIAPMNHPEIKYAANISLQPSLSSNRQQHSSFKTPSFDSCTCV